MHILTRPIIPAIVVLLLGGGTAWAAAVYGILFVYWSWKEGVL